MAELSYDQAVANLNKSGLTGNALVAAQGALKSHYAAETPASPGPTTQEVPGVGTLTITPKGVPAALASSSTPSSSSGVGDNAAGLYARTGVQPPAPAPELSYADASANLQKAGLSAAALKSAQAALDAHYGQTGGTSSTGYTAPSVAGLPQYPGIDTTGADPNSPQGQIMAAYKTTLDTITSLESTIASASVPSDQEKQLTDQLNAAKAKLAQFDVDTLSAEEGLRGQGRGATLGTIDTQETILDRTRALERLGFATDADTIATQLSTAQSNRQAQGTLAQTEYDLATKKLDIALGVQNQLDSLNDKQQSDARQYLLDVVSFADGKTYDELDPATQQAITAAVAKSPITLGMVQTALQSGADKAAASAAGNLRTVSGVGVVQINPDGTYKVVVPENVDDHTSPSADVPSFNDYLASQNIPTPSLTPDKLAQLHSEYDATYGAGNDVDLGKLNATNKNDLSQAGLSSAPSAVQSYFLNAPSAFRDQYQRDYAAGKITGIASLDSLNQAYTDWYNAQKKGSSGSHDWASILGISSTTPAQ